MKNDTIRNWTVIGSFVMGWLITIAGFISPPTGEIDNSVIIIFGQAMTYCAVGVGMKDYVDTRIIRNNQKHNDDTDI